MNYQFQRFVFKEARKRGWRGYEPSALGTQSAEAAFHEARQYLIDLGASYRDAQMWFSGTCKYCGVWSPQWDEYSTLELKCPECGEKEYAAKLHMNVEKKITNSVFRNKNSNLDTIT